MYKYKINAIAIQLFCSDCRILNSNKMLNCSFHLYSYNKLAIMCMQNCAVHPLSNSKKYMFLLGVNKHLLLENMEKLLTHLNSYVMVNKMGALLSILSLFRWKMTL